MEYESFLINSFEKSNFTRSKLLYLKKINSYIYHPLLCKSTKSLNRRDMMILSCMSSFFSLLLLVCPGIQHSVTNESFAVIIERTYAATAYGIQKV